jgi:hypothetical protein
MRRPITAAVLAVAASLAVASTAFAMDCTNASRSDPAAGAQALIDGATGQVVWVSNGLAQRLEAGVVSPTGEGFHGLIAIDFNGDGVADVSTWVGVGPTGEALPVTALVNGPACRGVTSIEVYLAECLVP